MKQLDIKHVNLAGTMVSTVRLCSLFMSQKYPYETCIFWANGGSDVVESYKTQADAIKGHEKYCKEVGASNKVVV